MKIVHSVAFFRSDSSGYESPRSGTSQGIFFKNFIKLVVYAHYAAFRGWELRIYHDDRVTAFEDFKFLDRCHEAGLLKLVYMGKVPSLCGGMLWRMLPIWDSDSDVVVCRDVDSLPMDRDRLMVEEFAASEASVHAILDSESHCGPLMGGMVAFKSSAIRSYFPEGLQSLIDSAKGIEFDKHGADQRFLNEVIWPKFTNKTFIHQRREDVQYPQAFATKKVAPQVTALDKTVRHIGAAYPRDPAWEILKGERRYELGSGIRPLEMLDSMEWPPRGDSTEIGGSNNEPWYTRPAITFLENVIKPDWRVYESGGGASSEWYSKRCSTVETYEANLLFKTMIRLKAPTVKLNGDREGAYDLVAIDGTDRFNEIRDLRDSVKPGGYLLLDNAETLPEAGNLLSGWKRIDFPTRWLTSVWQKPE